MLGTTAAAEGDTIWADFACWNTFVFSIFNLLTACIKIPISASLNFIFFPVVTCSPAVNPALTDYFSHLLHLNHINTSDSYFLCRFRMLTRWLTFTALLAGSANPERAAITVAPTCRVKGHPETELTLKCGDRKNAGQQSGSRQTKMAIQSPASTNEQFNLFDFTRIMHWVSRLLHKESWKSCLLFQCMFFKLRLIRFRWEIENYN